MSKQRGKQSSIDGNHSKLSVAGGAVSSKGNGERSAVAVKATAISGPLPSAEEMQVYAEINPSLVDRIFSMAEKEQDHRHEINRQKMALLEKAREDNFKEGRLGQIFAFLIGIFAILAGGYSATNGAQVAGSLIGAGGVVGLVSVFILGRARKDQKPSEAKSED